MPKPIKLGRLKFVLNTPLKALHLLSSIEAGSIELTLIIDKNFLGGVNFNSFDIKARFFSSNLFKKFTLSSDSMFLNIFHEFLFKAAQEVKN
ncbi:uncharacterized protein METZ01_LOCUS14826 [marine metagenome]|uniref:Uncharacterized protein n=1 Tax=marine metagenome TaxID=408172 RepID=A0A381P4W1_9ZZZZ